MEPICNVVSASLAMMWALQHNYWMILIYQAKHLSSMTTKVDSSNVAGRARESPFPMISVNDAQKIVLDQCSTLGTIAVKFSDALGYVLAEDVFATDPLPPFPASIKDG